MLNTYILYNPPHLQKAKLWLNLDPRFIAPNGVAIGSNVTDWINVIRFSTIFTQDASGKQPSYEDTHIEFDGNDWLGAGDDQIYDTSAGGWTAVFRYTMDDWTVNDSVLGDDSANNSFIRNNGNTGLTIKAWDGSGVVTKGITIDTPASLVNDTYYNFILQCEEDLGNMDLWVDGVEQASSPNLGATFDIVIDEVGGKNGSAMQLEGKIQEIIMYGTILSDLEVADVNAYLDNKF